MSEQRTLASVAYGTKRKVTRRERFLREMDAVIPWPALRALIAPHYTVAGRGRRPLPLETMLRVYFLQQWFDVSDPQAADLLYDSEAMRRFARVELGEDTVPDESTILRFRHLEQHQLTAAMFDAVKTLLTEKRLLLKAGTIVDASITAKERLAQFGPTLHEEKTRVLEFCRLPALARKQRGERRLGTSAFLGFTHYRGWTRDGRFVVKRKTQRQRVTAKLKTLNVEAKRRRHVPVCDQNCGVITRISARQATSGTAGVFISCTVDLVPCVVSAEPTSAHMGSV